VTAGLNSFQFAGYTVNYNHIPKGQGTRGIIIADPCFTNSTLVCQFGEKYQTYMKTTNLMNALIDRDDNQISYFQILGDNFYDVGKLNFIVMQLIFGSKLQVLCVFDCHEPSF
jgi:hypothetical protein